MSVETKYRITLAMFVVGGVLVVAGFSTLSGSFGVKALVQQGLSLMVPGVALVIAGGPAFYYFRTLRKIPKTKNTMEIESLIGRGDKK